MSELMEKETLKQKMEPPKMWNVVMYNDDFTPFDFVIACLMYIFNKSESEAARITSDIHTKGKGLVGQYTYEMAETKQYMAQQFAIKEQYPLKIEIEQSS